VKEIGRILLGHGGGGRLSRRLIEEEIVSRFGGGPLEGLPDGARLSPSPGEIVFSTDSFVVQPLEFPGGNIGHLAVHGTVNDVAVSGGRPRWLSLGMILEEGLELALLRRILDAVRDAARECGVVVATGDTKVVAAGQCDGVYLNTAGIGEAIPGLRLSVDAIRPGDAVLVNGPLADHGMAVMAARAGMDVGERLRSDTAPVHRLVEAIADLGADVRFMRDPTRGGLAAVLNEIVDGRGIGIALREADLPFSDGARAIAEVTGIDPLHVASEGRLVLVCAAGAAEEVLRRWSGLAEGRGAVAVGEVCEERGRVIMRTVIGGRRLVDVPHGELLPRIC
jgi:hydrogenase expression/formation protein HypE